jgi:hypothetical protein
MPELVLHGKPVETIFDLLGRSENDMTYALGWGLTRSAKVLEGFAARVAPGVQLSEPVVVDLQEHDALDGGFTDIEVLSADLHVIVEAKRSWGPPGEAQLRRYEARFARAGRPVQSLVVLTQNGAESVVRHQIGDWAPPAPIEAHVIGWSDVVRLIRTAGRGGPLAERRLARELADYLGGLADMRNTDSNSVYVVAVATTPFASWPADITPIDIVEKWSRYHFPAVGNWPKTPPNYMAFRYYGRLQSIHHVDEYTIFENPHQADPAWPDLGWDPHFLLTLGPAIRPPTEVRTGKGIVRSARVWVDIDLLLTSATITEAAQRTRERKASSG